jgi:hypothetical protein
MGAPTVRDASGAFVGFAMPGGALRNVDDTTVLFLPVDTTGFLQPDYNSFVGYPMADCAGQPYVWEANNSFTHYANVIGNQAFFAGGPATSPVSIQSFRSPNTDFQSFSIVGTCACAAGGYDCCNCALETLPLEPARMFDLDTLGLVPPFRIDLPQ